MNELELSNTQAVIFTLLLLGLLFYLNRRDRKKSAQIERESKNGIDGLTSVELTNYQRLEDMAIAMINLNRGYSEIKALIFKV